MTPNDGVDFTTNSEEADVNATDRTKLMRMGKPLICHIFGKNHYANRCPDREESTPGKKSDKVEENPKNESPPTKASVHFTIGEDWGDDTNFWVLMFCQVTAGTVV